MPQIIIGLILIALAIWLVVLVVWISAVFVLRLVGTILTYSLVITGAALLAGVIIGLVMPIRVLRGHGSTSPVIATPEGVRDGKVFASPPKGVSAHFGWDFAWPNYVPYQLRLDQAEVLGEARRITAEIRRRTRSWWYYPGAWYLRVPSNVLWFVVFGLPTWGLVLGVRVGTLLWWLVTGVLRVAVATTQRVVLQLMRFQEARFMKKEGATVRCVSCYRVTDMPSFRCSDARCGVLHRDVAPGRLGIRSRICGCGASLPLTVAAATQVLAAVCPFCDHELARGSGSRRVVVVPVFGPVGVGKTQFLATSAVSLHARARAADSPFGFRGLSSAAEEFLTVSIDESEAGRAPAKTTHRDHPEGYPYLIDRPEHPFELHLMDAAGENFVGAENSRALGYLDISSTLIFLFDPLTIPEVAEHVAHSAESARVQVAQGSASAAYGSVVDRILDGGQSLAKRHLGVVLTKADVIAEVLPGDQLPSDSPGIREWLVAHGEDSLVRRIELDFTSVTYFAVDSTAAETGDSDAHPMRVVDWSLRQHGGVSLFPEPVVMQKEEVVA
jgi:hypothetical protein